MAGEYKTLWAVAILCAATLMAIVGKLTGILAWTWPAVFAVLWVPVVLMLIIAAIVLVTLAAAR